MSCTERRNQQGWDPASGGGWGENRGTQKPQDRVEPGLRALWALSHCLFFLFVCFLQWPGSWFQTCSLLLLGNRWSSLALCMKIPAPLSDTGLLGFHQGAFNLKLQQQIFALVFFSYLWKKGSCEWVLDARSPIIIQKNMFRCKVFGVLSELLWLNSL